MECKPVNQPQDEMTDTKADPRAASEQRPDRGRSGFADRARLVWFLARSELGRRFAGTAGGVLWAALGPVLMIGVVWFALDIGLGLRASVGPDYGVALIVGMIAWQMVSESINDSTSIITRNSHLVKKIVFSVELLPVASALAAGIIHMALLTVLMLALAFLNVLSWGTLWQLPLWFALLFTTITVLNLLAATLNVVFRDLSAVVPFMMSAAFWLTPVVWMSDKLPASWRAVALANPFALAVEGYRAALLGRPLPFTTATAVASMVAVACIGALSCYLFRLYRPDFADYL